MTEFTLEVPYAMQFGDYHDIDDHADTVNDHPAIVMPDKLKSYECGFHGVYFAVFYVGKRPSRTEMKKLVQRDCDCDPDNIDWRWIKS